MRLLSMDEQNNLNPDMMEDLSEDSKPLTDWKNAPTVRDLKQDFQDAKPDHDTYVTKIEGWLDNLNVTGGAKVKSPKGNSQIVPKLIRKQAEWRYAALSEPFLSTDDLFNVRPVSWEDKEAAVQNEYVLGHQFNTVIDKTGFIDEYVRTAVDEGTVIVRVGWKFEEEEYEYEAPIIEFQPNPEMAQIHQELAMMMQENPNKFYTDIPEELQKAHELSMQSGVPFEGIITGYETKKGIRTSKNHPTVEVCNYRNVYIDPTCQGKLDEAKFVIYSFETSLSELEKDGKYTNLNRINVESNTVLGEPDYGTNDGSRNFNFSDKPRKKFVVHEYWGYWDIDGTGIVKPIVAAWVGETLIRMEENPFPDKKAPFVTVQYLPVRKSIYGEPDGALLEDNQKILGAVTRGMIDIMGKSANGQTGIRKDALDRTNRIRFDKGQDYEFNPQVDPRQGIYMHTYPEIPNSAQFMLQLQNMEAESLTGVKAFSQGISGASLGDVAASVRGALDAASKRELGILRRLSNGIIQIGKKIVTMNAEFLSDEEIIRITNEEFVKVRREELGGKFDIRLSISTVEEDNNKAQELAFMLQTMGNTLDPSMSKLILSEVARLRKMPDLAKQIKDFEPQPDPLLQKQRELEVQLLEAKLQNELAQAQERRINAQLDMAKIGTEQAKAAHLSSDTDLKNLDFVEQEAGVKQERDLQLYGEQARSNAALKTMEMGYNKEKEDRDFAKEILLNNMKSGVQ